LKTKEGTGGAIRARPGGRRGENPEFFSIACFKKIRRNAGVKNSRGGAGMRRIKIIFYQNLQVLRPCKIL
jgi:hypothetical protein